MTKKVALCVLHNAFAVEKRTTHRYVAYVLLELKLFSVHVNEVDACLSLCNVIGKVADLVFTEPSIPVDTLLTDASPSENGWMLRYLNSIASRPSSSM